MPAAVTQPMLDLGPVTGSFFFCIFFLAQPREGAFLVCESPRIHAVVRLGMHSATVGVVLMRDIDRWP